MKKWILVVVVCVAIVVLAVWNNDRYSKVIQEVTRVEHEQDSICLVRYENLLQSIQNNTLIVDSLLQGHKSVDSLYLKNQEYLLQQMGVLISINKKLLKQNKKTKCSNLSTTYTAD